MEIAVTPLDILVWEKLQGTKCLVEPMIGRIWTWGFDQHHRLVELKTYGDVYKRDDDVTTNEGRMLFVNDEKGQKVFIDSVSLSVQKDFDLGGGMLNSSEPIHWLALK